MAVLHIPEALKRLQIYQDHPILSTHFKNGIKLPPSLEIVVAVEMVTSRIDWDDPISRIWEVMFRFQILDQAKAHLCPVVHSPTLDQTQSVISRRAGSRILADLKEMAEPPHDVVAMLVEPLAKSLGDIQRAMDRSTGDIDTIVTQNDRIGMQVAALASSVSSQGKKIDTLLDLVGKSAAQKDASGRKLDRYQAQICRLSRRVALLDRQLEEVARVTKSAKKTRRLCEGSSLANGGHLCSGRTDERAVKVHVAEDHCASTMSKSLDSLGWLKTLWRSYSGHFGEARQVVQSPVGIHHQPVLRTQFL